MAGFIEEAIANVCVTITLLCSSTANGCMFVFIYYVFVCEYRRVCVFYSNHHFPLARKKRQAEFETYMRRMVNRLKKDVLVDTHKVKTPTCSPYRRFHILPDSKSPQWAFGTL